MSDDLQTARDESESADDVATLRALVRKLKATLQTERGETDAKLRRLTEERDKLRRAYEALKVEVHLLKRRVYVAKAERIDTVQLELLFETKKRELEALASSLSDDERCEVAGILENLARSDSADSGGGSDSSRGKGKAKAKPKGRRDLSQEALPVERCEITDPALEGKHPCIGFEESSRVGYRPGGPVRIVVARAKYKVPEEQGSIVTAAMPKEALRRCMAAPSMLARILCDKFADGLPFYRQEERFARKGAQGFSLDRGTMCRWAEDAGATLGCIVQEMAKDAMARTFCLSTDATGVAIQPTRLEDGKRQACAKGHFFVVLADRDHVFFEYQAKHTSAAVCDMFRGFSRYIQADASAVYDALFRGEARARPSGEGPAAEAPTEVGCWAHARRKFFEAAVTLKDPFALEGLCRIRDVFERDAAWKGLPPEKRRAMRKALLGPLLQDFFGWAEKTFERLADARGPLHTAFGYVLRQRGPLLAFLADGRLKLDNNASERALRTIAVGRKNWLFFGSGDHAEAAANLFSLLASCKLHGIDPEAYLTDVLRVLPYWPRDRYLELAPLHWQRTRVTLDNNELQQLFGHVTVPPATRESAPK